MKNKFNFTRGVFHEILFTISLGFSLLQFFGFGNWTVASIIFAVLGFALEIEKRYLSRKVKRDFIDKNWKSLAPNAVILIIIVTLSCVAAYGAMKSSLLDKISDMEELENIQVEEVDVDNVNLQIKLIDSQIEGYNNVIRTAQHELDKMNEREEVYVPSLVAVNDEIKKANDEILLLMQTRTELAGLLQQVETVEDGSNKVSQYLSSSTTFKMIAEDFGLETRKVMKWLLYILVLVLEGSLFLTVSPLDSDETEVKKDEKELFTEYISSMFSNTGKYLLSDNKVSSQTGIPLNKCKKFRELLSGIKMRGNRSLIVKEEHGWVSHFPEQTVRSVGSKNLFLEE